MTALDACEPQIIRALENDGWSIIAKPFAIRPKGRNLYADLKIGKATETGQQEIVVVEVKCFTNPRSDFPDLYIAVGQYCFYRYGMDLNGDVEIPLYLALPFEAHLRFITNPVIMGTLESVGVKWVIVDTVLEVVVEWHH